MRSYLLDTTPLTAYLMGYRKAIALLSPWIAARQVATSILVYGEVHEYIGSFSNYADMLGQLRGLLLGPIPAYSLTFSVLERYSNIRRTLRPQNNLIGDIDTLIAATAQEYNLIVVTANPKHFRKVRGLHVQVY